MLRSALRFRVEILVLTLALIALPFAAGAKEESKIQIRLTDMSGNGNANGNGVGGAPAAIFDAADDGSGTVTGFVRFDPNPDVGELLLDFAVGSGSLVEVFNAGADPTVDLPALSGMLLWTSGTSVPRRVPDWLVEELRERARVSAQPLEVSVIHDVDAAPVVEDQVQLVAVVGVLRPRDELGQQLQCVDRGQRRG
jgi:hypothetical protein